MQTTTLIHTIGNSDLQFNAKIVSSDFADKYLKDNKNNKNYKVPDPDNFKEYTAEFLEDIRMGNTEGKKILETMQFPLLNAACEWLRERDYSIDQVVIIGTNQIPSHHKDTLYVCKILEYCYKDIWGSDIGELKSGYLIQNIKGIEAETYVYQTVIEIMEKHATDQTFLSTQSGIPDISTAFRLAGFRRNYRYLQQNPQTDGSTKCFEISNTALYQLIENRI